MSSIVPVEKLSGRENYNDWEFAMKAYLQHEDLWPAVNGTDEIADGKEKEKRDTKAKSKIVMCVKPSVFVHIRSLETSKEVWDKLKNVYQDKGLSRRVALMRKMIMTKLEDCKSMEDYVTTVLTTAQMLNDVDFEVNDEWIGTFLLAGLPEKYQPMIMAMESTGQKVDSDLVKTKLLQGIPGKFDGDSTALFSKNGKSNSNMSKVRCYACNNYGHFSNQCPMKKNKNEHNSKQKSLLSIFAVNHFPAADEWYIDSGASSHMTNDSAILTSCEKLSTDKTVTIANNEKIPVKSAGKCELDIQLGANTSTVTVDVLHVPNLSTNLISVSQMAKNGKRIIFDDKKCEIFDKSNSLVATASLIGDMYKLDMSKSKLTDTSYIAKQNPESDLWHRRMGHMNQCSMKLLQSMTDTAVRDSNVTEKCEVCCLGKQHKLSFGTSTSSTADKLELIHADVCGPMEEASIGGSRYFLSLIDDYTHKTFVYFLKSKAEVTQVFKVFKQFVEKQTGKEIKILRSDNGGEFCNSEMRMFTQQHGIQHQTTIPYNPQQNGLSERMNRTIVERARCMMIDAGLPKRFWAEAINTAVYLINRSPTRAVPNKTPEEAWTGRKVDLANLKVFGSSVMVHVPKQKRRKLDPTATKQIMVGYCDNQKGYRVFSEETGQVTSTRDAVFIESCVRSKSDEVCNANNITFLELSPDHSEQLVQTSNGANQLIHDVPNEVGDVSNEVEDGDSVISSELDHDDNDDDYNTGAEDLSTNNDESASSDSEYVPENNLLLNNQNNDMRRTARVPKLNQRDDFVYSSTESYDANDPLTVADALSRSDAKMWKDAMDAEYSAIIDNNTWSLSEPVPHQKPIMSKWVFKTKVQQDGSLRYKARLVIKGCAQRAGIDYQETYSPVVKYNSIRYLLAMATEENMIIEQMDAVSAFLQGELEETVYMIQPDEYADGSARVCKLNKALYGLKQAGRAWNQKLDKVLCDIGLTRSKADRCIYFKMCGSSKLIIAVYVDDLLIFSSDQQQCDMIKFELNKWFKMKDIGKAKSILGFRIARSQTNNVLWLDQEDYIAKILERFNMTNCNPVSTPADVNVKIDKNMSPKTEAEVEEMKKIPYQEAVGSLLYAAQGTRPDISYAVNVVSRYTNNPGKQHWNAVKRIFRYLKGSIGAKLEYRTNKTPDAAYSDADWASDADERKSTTGYVFLKCGGAITWSSRKQQTVALSTTEAEYMALSASAQEALWIRKLDCELSTSKCIPIYCDNRSAINLSKTDSFHPRTKHIDIRHHFVKETVESSSIQIIPIGTDNMVADVLTKGLPKDKHNQHCLSMGVNFK